MDYRSIVDFVDEVLKRKDPYNHHGSKVSTLCLNMAALMGNPFNLHELEMLKFGAQLHDVGKLFVEDGILNSHGVLTENQFAIVRTHAKQGFRLALSVGFDPLICGIIHFHHENFDGSGYPQGLKGEEIPIFARMVRVADTYDALTSRRAYRHAASHEEAIGIIEAETGRCFDPLTVTLLKQSCEGKVGTDG
jgi:HD-GYP domain-containing protein (c-di-GMP phosphodiesterase class II)